MTWGQCSGEVVVGHVAMQADDGVVVGIEVWIVVFSQPDSIINCIK
jgi:hypothetical protein